MLNINELISALKMEQACWESREERRPRESNIKWPWDKEKQLGLNRWDSTVFQKVEDILDLGMYK
jgi:hypothetical protein